MSKLILLAASIIITQSTFIQTNCTDPQAINYNPTATQNDGSYLSAINCLL